MASPKQIQSVNIIGPSIKFKIIISVAAGILCFVFSKYSIIIQTTEVEFAIPWAIVFPFIIILAYGIRFGLIAGLFGGIIYPFYLFPENGWANVLSTGYIMFLFVLIGIYAKKQNSFKKLVDLQLFRFILCLIYFVFSYVCLIYLYNWFLGFNPAFWASDTVQNFPEKILFQFFIKDYINFLLLVIFADTLLHVVSVRKLLRLPVEFYMRKNGMVMVLSIAVALFVWLLLKLSGNYFLPGNLRNTGHFLLEFFVLFWAGGIFGRILMFYQEQGLKSQKEIVASKLRAEESDRLKSAFLANMSHEIRTPMNGILGFTSLLSESGLSDEEKERFLDIIKKSGERLLSTVNDIIEVSKIETGQINILLKKVDIIEHIESLILFFKPEAQGNNIKLIFENNCNSNNLKVETDELKLNSILTNLIKNALKFTPAGHIKISVSCSGSVLYFSVSDTGIGIVPERQQAIFNRFEQADIEDSQAYEGSGLGLSIVKSYVEMLGGEVQLKSIPEKGSTFSFSLPISTSSIETNEKKSPSDHSKNTTSEKKLTILIAEDEEISFTYLSILLEKFSKQIIHAKNGQEAIDYCQKIPDLDLLLMDIKMPKINGIEATKEIRKFNKNLIIVAQSAYVFDSDKKKCRKAGCNDFISKPISQKKLGKLIEQYF